MESFAKRGSLMIKKTPPPNKHKVDQIMAKLSGSCERKETLRAHTVCLFDWLGRNLRFKSVSVKCKINIQRAAEINWYQIKCGCCFQSCQNILSVYTETFPFLEEPETLSSPSLWKQPSFMQSNPVATFCSKASVKDQQKPLLCLENSLGMREKVFLLTRQPHFAQIYCRSDQITFLGLVK